MGKRDETTTASQPGNAQSAKGLLDRRTLLRAGVFAAGIAGVGVDIAQPADTIGTDAPEWMKTPGRSFSSYGVPSKWQENVKRPFAIAPGRPGTGSSRTPLELLDGTITPSGLHFERHHNGIPDIDPGKHELFIHGMVKNPLAFSVETLMRYPMELRLCFIECPGNSGAYAQPQPAQTTAGGINGLISCSEKWSGVRFVHLS